MASSRAVKSTMLASTPRPLRWTLPLAAALAAMACLAPLASAHDTNWREDQTHGTVVLDLEMGEGVCDVTIEADHFDAQNGSLSIYHATEGIAPHILLHEDTFNGTPEEDGEGFEFVAGPYEIELGSDPTTDPSEMYVVLSFSADGADHQVYRFFDTTCSEPPTPFPCPDVSAVANGDGSITLTWDEVSSHSGEKASEYNIYRAVGDEEIPDTPHVVVPDSSTVPEEEAEDFEPGTFVDTDTEAGVTYSYRVTALGIGLQSRGCETVEVTAVPFFGAPVIGVLALLGSAGAYSVLRRR